jgi:hypothetical protein
MNSKIYKKIKIIKDLEMELKVKKIFIQHHNAIIDLSSFLAASSIFISGLGRFRTILVYAIYSLIESLFLFFKLKYEGGMLIRLSPKCNQIYPKRPERIENIVRDGTVKLLDNKGILRNLQVKGPLIKIV